MWNQASWKHRQRGTALIMLTLMVAAVLIPMVGLAIDASTLYLIKTKLSSAVDAAALAGARSLSSGLDLGSQISGAQSTVQTFFNANFPAGYCGTTNPSLTINIQETAFKTRTISVQASVDGPLYFMRILGSKTTQVAAQGESSRRDVNVILVLDRSSSMQSAGVCGTMIAAARSFVDKFTNGRDRFGLITFMGDSNLDFAPTVDFKTANPSLDTQLSKLKCGGNTGSAQALTQAYQQIKNVNEPGALNLIVFFTDGLPNGITAKFPIKTLADTRLDVNGNPVALPASKCTSTADKQGFIAQSANSQPTGKTDGIMNEVASSISSTSQPVIASSGGCAFATTLDDMRKDVAYIPAADLYGNSTTGYKTCTNFTFPTGPYANKIRVDVPATISTASTNAADDAAKKIHQDITYKPVIYVIGLGGTSTEPLDQVFLHRVANDTQSPIYDSLEPTGLFVYSPTATQLNDAFNKVASEILRLAQ